MKIKFSFHFNPMDDGQGTIAVYQNGTSDIATQEQLSKLLLILNEKAEELGIEQAE